MTASVKRLRRRSDQHAAAADELLGRIQQMAKSSLTLDPMIGVGLAVTALAHTVMSGRELMAAALELDYPEPAADENRADPAG